MDLGREWLRGEINESDTGSVLERADLQEQNGWEINRARTKEQVSRRVQASCALAGKQAASSRGHRELPGETEMSVLESNEANPLLGQKMARGQPSE